MRKRLLTMTFCALLGGAVQAEDLSDFLPFLQAPEQSSTEDTAGLERRLMDYELEASDLQRRLQGVEEQQSRLEDQLEGFRIYGYGLGQLRRFHVTGQGAESARDFLGRPLWYDAVENEAQTQGSKANERILMTISGRPNSQLEVVSDLNARSIWGGAPQLTTDNIAIRVNSSLISAIAGTYWAEFTPLTLYYAADHPWFESSLFQRPREDWLGEQGIQGSKRKLEGVYSELTLENLYLKGLMSRVRSKDGASPFHRYLTGFSLTLFPQRQSFLGANWVSLADDPSTGSGEAARGELLGIDWQVKLRQNLFCSGEYVRSSYDDDVATGLAAIPDQASVTELLWRGEKLLLQTRLLKVGPYYYAPTSQSRQYDLSVLSVFGPDEAQSAMGTAIARTLEALPYGLSTPNRRGYQFRALYQPQGRLLAAFERTDLNELRPADAGGTIVTALNSKRHYTVEKLGAEADLTGFLKVGGLELPSRELKLLGQLERRTVSRRDDPQTPGDEQLAFTSSITDLGLAYQLYPGWRLVWGQKQTKNQGELEGSQLTNAFGVEIAISSQTVLEVTSKKSAFRDSADAAGDYEAKVLELSLKANF